MKVRQRTDGRKLTIKRAASANFAPKQEKPALMTSHKTQKEQEFPYIKYLLAKLKNVFFNLKKFLERMVYYESATKNRRPQTDNKAGCKC